MFSKFKKNSFWIVFLCLIGFVVQFRAILKAFFIYESPKYNIQFNLKQDNDMISFEGFNNETGADHYIVPNIFHLIFLKITHLKFYQMINIFAIYLNHMPDFIYIHCDNCSFHGRRWTKLMSIKDLRDRIVIHKTLKENSIFGIEYGWAEHRSDTLRGQILANYGGIYIDLDVYLVKSLNEFRKYEMVLSWNDGEKEIGNQVLIGHKNARFLHAFLDQYRTNYNKSSWFYNAGKNI
jgi:hypothetical protein